MEIDVVCLLLIMPQTVQNPQQTINNMRTNI